VGVLQSTLFNAIVENGKAAAANFPVSGVQKHHHHQHQQQQQQQRCLQQQHHQHHIRHVWRSSRSARCSILPSSSISSTLLCMF
jgi:ribosome-binding ATPase YchF (GTP1/OBG family)